MNRQFPKKAVHGGKIQEFRHRTGLEFLDVSASMNPYVPEVSCDFSKVDLSTYPDDTYATLKESIGSIYSRNPEEICVGNGSAELIRTYCHTVLSPGDIARIDPPTFAEYRLSAELAGARVIPRADRPAAQFICNPNNPTGILQTRSQITAALDNCIDTGSRLFIDEAFMELTEPQHSVTDLRSDALFVMRSLTKCFSVPGLRFGYGFGDPDLIEKIETARTPWTVNTFAEQYALEAFRHYHELQSSAKKITAERLWYYHKLDELGLTYSNSSTNYILIDLKRNATTFCEALMKKSILVRDCTSFGLPNSIRVAVDTREKNQRVLEAIDACLR